VVAGGGLVGGVVTIGSSGQPLATKRQTIMTRLASRYFRFSFFIGKFSASSLMIVSGY